MLRSDENRERTAYTCIMYMYMYIIIFSHIYIIYIYYISLYRAFYFCLKFISSLFSFFETTGCRRTSRKAVEDARRVFSFSSFFFFHILHGIKGRFPPLHGPRIYLILVLFFIFSLFFSFLLLLLLYLHARARNGKSRDARARDS